MKTTRIISLIICMILIGTATIVLSSCQKQDGSEPSPQPTQSPEPKVTYTMEQRSGNLTFEAEAVLDAESARKLADQAITEATEADYKFECLIFTEAVKRTDSRNGEEFWSVGYRCNDECEATYINCGAGVIIKERTCEILLAYPN